MSKCEKCGRDYIFNCYCEAHRHSVNAENAEKADVLEWLVRKIDEGSLRLETDFETGINYIEMRDGMDYDTTHMPFPITNEDRDERVKLTIAALIALMRKERGE